MYIYCRWYEELKAQYELEKTKLSDNASALKIEIKDLSDKISTLNADKSELDTKLKSMEKQMKSVYGIC